MAALIEEIKKLATKIEALESEIAEANKEVPPHREFLINLGQQLVEARKKKNILLEREQKIG